MGNDPVALGAHVVGSLAAAKPAQENRTPVRLGMKVKHLPTDVRLTAEKTRGRLYISSAQQCSSAVLPSLHQQS